MTAVTRLSPALLPRQALLTYIAPREPMCAVFFEFRLGANAAMPAHRSSSLQTNQVRLAIVARHSLLESALSISRSRLKASGCRISASRRMSRRASASLTPIWLTSIVAAKTRLPFRDLLVGDLCEQDVRRSNGLTGIELVEKLAHRFVRPWNDI